MAPLRIVVVGAGWGAGLHLEGFGRVAAGDVEVVAISSRTRSSAEAMAEGHGVPHVYTELGAALAEQQPDVVSIATPPAVHDQQVLMALAQGAHVLCDKPVALTGATSRSLYRAVEDQGRKHATGFIWRNDPGILKLREMLASGAIGEIRDVHSSSALGAPVLPMTWIYDRAAGGGALMQHGGHVIDRARWILGREITGVNGELVHDVKEAVVGPQFHNVLDAFAFAGKRMAQGPAAEQLPTAPVTADTGYGFAARFEGDVRGWFWESMHGHGVPEQLTVFGSRGTLVWAGPQGLTMIRPRSAPERVEVEGASLAGTGEMAGQAEVGHRLWGRMCQAFVDDILGRDHEPYPTLYDGWKVQQVIDAVHVSNDSRRWEPCTD